ACCGSAPRIGCEVSLLVVGSIALDSVATPFGETADAPGGSAVFFAAAGAVLHPVQVVGVVGSDYPLAALKSLEARGVDLSGVEQAAGESFRWKAKHSYDLSSRETLDTRLGVFAQFRPKLPEKFRQARHVFLGNIDPELQLGVLDQIPNPALVACDTMNYWIHSKRDLLLELLRHIDILMGNDALTSPNLRRAMVYGAAMGSFAVEAFGVQGFDRVTLADVRARVRGFKDLVHFEVDEDRGP